MKLMVLGKNHKVREICLAVYLQMFKRLYWKHPSLFSLPHTPFFIELELTNQCNLSCPHCHGRLQKRQIGNMSDVLFKKLVDEINHYPYCNLFLCGLGEPALHPDISKYFDYLQPLDMKVHIATNGTLFDRFDPDKILDWNIDVITVSVDGFDPDTYLLHRPGGDYQKLKTSVRNFYEARSRRKRRDPVIRIANVLFPDEINDSSIDKFRRDWIRFSDVVTFTALMPIERQTYEVLNQCNNTIFSINVRWNGCIPICAFHSMEFVGDANYSSIKEIFNCKEKRELQACHLRKEFDKYEFCKHCFSTQDKKHTASLHSYNMHKSKLLTAVNFLYRKLNLGVR